MIVTVATLKEQINQTLDIDDALIERKILAAQSHIERLLGFKIEENYGGEDQDELPDDLIEAVCLLAAWWYDQRETAITGTIVATIPYGVQDIVREYRCYSYGG